MGRGLRCCSPRLLQTPYLEMPSGLLLRFFFPKGLEMTIGFVMGVLALISNSFFFFFDFLWGLPTPGLLKTIQTSFPFLECRVLQRYCARVLYGAVPDEASWADPPPSTGSLNLAVFVFFLIFFPWGLGWGT